jgi:hypothetical protein
VIRATLDELHGCQMMTAPRATRPHQRGLPSVTSASDLRGVLTGAIEDPDALWLEQPDGELHSWDDDERIFETFEKFTT